MVETWSIQQNFSPLINEANKGCIILRVSSMILFSFIKNLVTNDVFFVCSIHLLVQALEHTIIFFFVLITKKFEIVYISGV